MILVLNQFELFIKAAYLKYFSFELKSTMLLARKFLSEK